MRVIFESSPTFLNIGKVQPGQRTGRAFLRVIQFEPDEEPPPVPNAQYAKAITWRLADLRKQAGPGNPIISSPIPASPLNGRVAPVAVPEAVLAGLPEDAKLQLIWRFEA
jgi:hypothetical protein